MTAVDQVDDGLRLREIHAVIEKRAPGKFARERLSGPGGKERAQTRAQHRGRAVALQLGGVLAGVAVRAAADRAEAEIEHAPVGGLQRAVDELSILRRRHGPAICREKHPVDHRERLRPGDAENSDRGDHIPSGNRGNGVRHKIVPSEWKYKLIELGVRS